MALDPLGTNSEEECYPSGVALGSPTSLAALRNAFPGLSLVAKVTTPSQALGDIPGSDWPHLSGVHGKAGLTLAFQQGQRTTAKREVGFPEALSPA